MDFRLVSGFFYFIYFIYLDLRWKSPTTRMLLEQEQGVSPPGGVGAGVGPQLMTGLPRTQAVTKSGFHSLKQIQALLAQAAD